MINHLTKITPHEACYLFFERHKKDLLPRLDQAIAFYLEAASKLRSLENKEIEKDALKHFRVGSIEILTICFLSDNTHVLKHLLADREGKKFWLFHKERTNLKRFGSCKPTPEATTKFIEKRKEISQQIDVVKKDIQIANSLLNVFVAIKKI